MTKSRGVPLITVLVLLTGWVGLRLGQNSLAMPNLQKVAALRSNSNSQMPHIAMNDVAKSRIYFSGLTVEKNLEVRSEKLKPASMNQNIVAMVILPTAHLATKKLTPPAVGMNDSFGLSDITLPDEQRDNNLPRLEAYAYSFWRTSGTKSGLAPAGQYGGSQSGLVVSYRLGRSANAPAIFGRTSVSPGSSGEREGALGLKWTPLRKVPASLLVERRFRNSTNDAFAIIAAGGKNDVSLPYKFKLHGYGQAGVIIGASQDRFFDASVRMDHGLKEDGAGKVSAGAGMWSGGQKGIARLDIGPSMRLDFSIAGQPINVSADYRFRIAGNASPKSGPAFTISTGF